MIKKKIIALLGVGLLVCFFSLFSDSAQAALNLGGLVGWYHSSFGEVNDYLDDVNEYWGTNLEFRGGLMYGITVDYEIIPNFKLRGRWSSFVTETSDNGQRTADFRYEADYKLSVNVLTLSGVYAMPRKEAASPYVGVGVSQFATKFQWSEAGLLNGAPFLTSFGSETEGSVGFEVLAGIEYDTGRFLLRGEASYVSAEAEMEDFESARRGAALVTRTTIDLSGLFLSLGVVIGL